MPTRNALFLWMASRRPSRTQKMATARRFRLTTPTGLTMALRRTRMACSNPTTGPTTQIRLICQQSVMVRPSASYLRSVCITVSYLRSVCITVSHLRSVCRPITVSYLVMCIGQSAGQSLSQSQSTNLSSSRTETDAVYHGLECVVQFEIEHEIHIFIFLFLYLF